MARNRSEGGKYGKLSGHQNEDKIHHKVNEKDPTFRDSLGKQLDCKIISAIPRDGLKEKKVDGVLADKTTPKKDLEVNCSDGKTKRISIKKTFDSQVFEITVDNFIKGYEHHFKEYIPINVKKGLTLFLGQHPEIDIILDNLKLVITDKKIREYEIKKKRLTCMSLRELSPVIYKDLLDWFKVKIRNICDFSFATGLALSETDWAEYLWYKNLVDEKLKFKTLDSIFEIKKLCEACIKDTDIKIVYGTKNGGTTIHLPFGSLQWHQGKMQFRHNFKKITKLF